MSLFKKQVAVNSGTGSNPIWVGETALRENAADGEIEQENKPREFPHLVATFITTLSCFGVFLIQGMIIARILGPLGRGEFGSAIYFPRDILLYAGLLGGIEIVNAYAKKGTLDPGSLKQSAAKLGIVSGLITAGVAAVIAIAVFTLMTRPTLVAQITICHRSRSPEQAEA